MKFDIDEIQDYIKQLCIRHTDVQHGLNGQQSFARFHLEEEVNALRNSAGKCIVVVGNITGRRSGHRDDKTLQREITLRFAVYADMNGEIDAARNAAMRKAEEVMFDFMAEMEKKQEADFDEDTQCGLMNHLQSEGFNWEEIEDQPWLVHHYGWDLTIPFKVYMPAHNAAKWNP